MCGGGGRVKEPDPMKEAEAQIRLLQQQFALQEQQAQAAAERERQQEEAARGQWRNDMLDARSRAAGGIYRQFQDTGLNPGEYEDRINAALDQAAGGLSFGMNPVFSSDIGSNLLDTLRNQKIKEYQRSINEFAPEGFEQNAFASTADDAILEAILGEQFGEASDSILRARDRGTLNDVGYNYASQNLEQQRKAALARLQDMGGGVLEGYRKQLGDIVGTARSGAGSWDFGDTFEPNTYRTQMDQRRLELGGRMEGDIRNAIGGEQFFNIDQLIQKGGIGQGAQNTGMGAQSGSLLSAIAQRRKDEETQRGLGTTGSF